MKRNMSLSNILIAVLWTICIGTVGVGVGLLSVPQAAAIQQAQLNVLENREQLALAQNAAKEQTQENLRRRVAQARQTLDAFACPAAAESALIFQMGQLAKTLELKHFTTRFPSLSPEQTMENNPYVAEGWLTMDFVADYLKLAAFINGLERHEPALFVESIELRRDENQDTDASVRMMLSYLIRKDQADKTTHARLSP